MPDKSFTLSLALAVACATASAMPPALLPAAPVARTAPAEVDLVQVAALRAQGPEALARLLAEYDRAPRPELAETIDLVAAQKYATVSRLYWYTDRSAAIAAAQQRHVPILELRLLGRLDEELSCANSRLFRASLYANSEVSAFLRESFVLLWTTERPVPKVTIDFGDGRTIHTTTTGNSAHFVLDERGGVVDVLPGLYAAGPFRAELEKSLAMVRTLDPSNIERRGTQIRAYHAEQAEASRAQWQMFSKPPYSHVISRVIQKAPAGQTAVARAQRLTVSKAYMETPTLARFGADPGSIADDETKAWAMIATLHWRLGDTSPILDTQAVKLVSALHNAGPVKATAPELAALIRRFEEHLLADSALDQFKLRVKIHDYLATHDNAYLALDRFLYGEVFQTPITDRWLGLLPRTDVTGLPGDGATTP
jgi:hypothetical protein